MCDIYYINGQLTYFECTDYCEKLFSDDDFVVTESVLDSIKNFFKSLKSKLKNLWEKLKSIFIKKNDKLEKIEQKAKNVDKNEKVTIPNLDKLETETVKQKKNKNKKIDPKKVLIGIGTVTLTVTGAILLVKKYRSKLQQKQNTKGKEVEETLDKTEKEINKKYELALIPGRNYDIGWKPMSSKEIKDSQENIGIKKRKDYIGAYAVTSNKNLGSDEDIDKKVNERLEELKKWEAEQKTKCTGLVIDEYTILSAELAVIESTIDTLDQEINQLNNAVDINKRRKHDIKQIGGEYVDSPIFDKNSQTGKWIEPETDDKIYHYIFAMIDKVTKIDNNNIRDIKFMRKLAEDLDQIADKIFDIKDSSWNSKDAAHKIVSDTRIVITGNNHHASDEEYQKYINGLTPDEIIRDMKNRTTTIVKRGLLYHNIFCTNSPYDWLKFAEFDKNDIDKRRESLSEIDNAIKKQQGLKKTYTNRKNDLTQKRDKLKSRIDEEKRKKDAEQKAFNKTREKNLEDIKTVSGKGGYDALYNKIKDEVKKA